MKVHEPGDVDRSQGVLLETSIGQSLSSLLGSCPDPEQAVSRGSRQPRWSTHGPRRRHVL